ncbi:McrC family protein [Roseovarius sp.]|uniref:McrC family protein n=1 Tax=Roseovarius sp. TaxID=1486281 RepID=UPI00356AEEA4
MQWITLNEYSASEPIQLTDRQVSQLGAPDIGMQIEAIDSRGACVIRTGSSVGVVCVDGLTLEIRPKIPLDRLFFMLVYAMDPRAWRHDETVFTPEMTVLESIVPAFVRLVSRATYRGLLQGYVRHEETSAALRGRLQVGKQMTRQRGLPLPVEIAYDDYTPDITENRLLLAALARLSRLPLRSLRSMRALREVGAAFQGVTHEAYRPADLPEIAVTRLNEHYTPALELARLILSNSTIELGQAVVPGVTLLVDMNQIFECFLHRALRESLKLDGRQFPRGDKRLFLDDRRRIKLEPDLSWWGEGRCRFVGDAKYKRIKVSGVPNADLYQLLAYTLAAGLDAGILIYAAGESEPTRHKVPMAGKTLIVDSVGLHGEPVQILREIDRLACAIRGLAKHVPTTRPTAFSN